MLKPTLNIAQDRSFSARQFSRVPGAIPVAAEDEYKFSVRGTCSEEFPSMSLARRYVGREVQKLVNGSLRPFVPTHTIYYRPAELGSVRRRIPVRVVDGACFQSKEWHPCTRAEFFYDVRNNILMHGNIILNWRWTIRPIAAPEPGIEPLMSAEEIARRDREHPGAEYVASDYIE